MKFTKLIACILIGALLLTACAPAAPAVSAAPAPSAAAQTAAPAAAATPTPAPSEAPQDSQKPAAEAPAGKLAGVYEQMKSAVKMPEMMEVSSDMVVDFYGIDPSEYKDGVFYVCADSLKADEVVLVEATDEAAAKQLTQQLNDRLKAKAEEAKGYSAEQFAIIGKCSVLSNGTQVALIVSPDAPALTKAYQDSMK